MKTALVLTPKAPADAVAGWATYPFKAYRFALFQELGLHVKQMNYGSLEDLPSILRESSACVAFVCTPWSSSSDRTVDTFRRIHEQREVNPRIAYLDTFDQSSSPFFGILPYVDMYVKKQLLRDRREYLRDVATGYIFGEFARKTLLAASSDWHFGSRVETPELLNKLRLGWNLGTAAHLTKRLRKINQGAYGPLAKRPLDVQYRVAFRGARNSDVYYNAHRASVSSRLNGLEGRNIVNVADYETRIPAEQFREELASCKLCIGAFGWGEVTDRDFEVVINEGALVKPDMSHLETFPDIYRAGETYIPFRWDASDLATVCEQALVNIDETQEIARNARAVYQDWVENKHFVKIVGGILDTLLA